MLELTQDQQDRMMQAKARVADRTRTAEEMYHAAVAILECVPPHYNDAQAGRYLRVPPTFVVRLKHAVHAFNKTWNP